MMQFVKTEFKGVRRRFIKIIYSVFWTWDLDLNHKNTKTQFVWPLKDTRKHKMRQEHLSKHFTTDINEILTVGL